jgi:hypothetical protein
MAGHTPLDIAEKMRISDSRFGALLQQDDDGCIPKLTLHAKLISHDRVASPKTRS